MSSEEPTKRAKSGNGSEQPEALKFAGGPNGAAGNEHDERPVLITGGAGFIGTNLAHRLLSAQRRVLLFDNLSRPGVERNLQWLQKVYGDRVQHVQGDVRDAHALHK